MTTPRLLQVLILAVLGLSAPLSHSAPFANGSFEDPGISVGTEAPISTVSGWTGTGTGLRYLKNGNSHPGAAARTGSHVVSFGHDGALQDSISQTFDTIPGRGYSVEFWLASIDGTETQAVTVEAFDGNTSLAPSTYDFIYSDEGQWQKGTTYTFTATSTSTKLVIKDEFVPWNPAANWALDDVTVTEITYPRGKVLGWGSGSGKQVPASLENVQAIAAGQGHSLALKQDGTVVAWGSNNNGQRTVPPLGPVKAIAAGGNHSMALLEDGTVVAWGEDFGDRAPPASLGKAKAIADAYIYSAAVREDGTVAVWGDFVAAGTPSLPPPAGLANVKAVSAGYAHLLALKEDGSVVAWGDDAFGQTEVPAEAASGVKAVLAAPSGSFAIKDDGTLISWGEVGIIPEGLTHVRTIAANDENFIAVKPDGTVVIWGLNSDPYSLPPGLSPVSQVAAGMSYSLALIEPLTPLPAPLEFNIASGNPGDSWEFRAKFPNQPGLYLRVQSVHVPPDGEPIEESAWTDLPGGGMMTLLDDGEDKNWILTTTDLPLGRQYFRVIAAAPDWADSKLVFSVPLKVESAAGPILYTQSDAVSRYLMLMESDGSDQVALTDGTLRPMLCALSPGSLRAAFVTQDGELYVMKAQPTDPVENVPVNVLEGAPVTANITSTMAWSPDGKRLAFAADDNKIYVLTVVGDEAEIIPYSAGTNPLTAVVDTLSSTPNPAWSPDGRHLALLGANHIQVFQIMNISGAITPQGPENPLVALTLVSDSATAKRSAAWSPDGQQLAFVERNVPGQVSFISILNARDGAGVLTPESESNQRLPLYDATDTPLAETVSWSRDGALLAVGAKDGFANYVEVFKPQLIDETNPRQILAAGNIEDGAYQPSFGGALMGTPPPDGDLPESTDFQIVRGLPGLPWTFSILQTSMIPGLTLRVESTLTPNDGDSWEDLPGGSLMTRDGDLWTLLSTQVPVGNRYFRVVAEVEGYAPQITTLPTPYLIEREEVDNTPPTLAVTHAWIEKINNKTHYRMYLDPRDETGFDPASTILVRTGPDAAKFNAWKPLAWTRGQAFGESFTGSSLVVEVQAQDAAGNKSTVQRRVFKSPLPIGTAPNLEPRFSGITPFAEDAIDCRGIFAANFDGEGVGDDILQIDRTSGEVRVRRQGANGVFTNNSFFLAPDSITDSAIGDFDGDGDPDIVIALGGTLKVYYNQGVDGGGALQFEETIPAGLSSLPASNTVSCAVGDVTGEGKPDIVMVSNANGGAAVVNLLVNDDDGELATGKAMVAGPGIVGSLMKLGDVNGDGYLDVFMVDTAGKQLIVFRNKGQGDFAGIMESDPAWYPAKVPTTVQSNPLPAQALAVADVTGDGRADAVVVMHSFSGTQQDLTDTRDFQMWQLFDGREDGSIHANPPDMVYHGPKVDSPSSYRSDVLLQDLNGDRFPELIFTSQFEDVPAGGSNRGGVLVLRMDCQLDAKNKLTSFTFTETPLSTDAANPHRLTAARFGNNPRKDIVLANGSNPQLQWISNGFTALTKSMDIVGAVSTQSDPEGTEQPNGAFTYFEYPGGYIDVTLTYANNTVNPFTGAIIESQLLATLELVPAETDPGYAISGTGASRVIRWTQNVPPGSGGVKKFRAKLLTNAKPATALNPKVTFKGGGKTLSVNLPKVTVQEPILLEWAEVVSFSDPSGNTAHLDDTLVYRARVTNRGPVPVTNTVLTMIVPTGTIYDDVFQNLPDIEKVVSSDKKKVTFTITNLNPGLPTPINPRVDVLVKATSGSIKATMTAQRPSGLKLTLPTWTTSIDNPVGITLVADKDTARPGDIIEYTLRAKNWGKQPLTRCRVFNAIPFGTKLLGARIRAGANYPNYLGDEEPEELLDEDTVSGDHPGYNRGAKPHLFWDIGSIPGGGEILMKYRVMVGVDVPTGYYPGGKYSQLSITNNLYNFTAEIGTSKVRLNALDPKGVTALEKPAIGLLPKNPGSGPKTIMSGADPLPTPKLTLQKTVIGGRDESVPDWWKYRLLPMEMNGAIPTYFVARDKKKTSDGRVTFLLCVANSGAAKAERVSIRDVVPDGFVFEGFLGINGQLNLAQDLHLSQFYDKTGKQLPPDPAQFPNYRSFDLHLGELQPGQVKTFYYQAYTTKNQSIKPIPSFSGGVAGILNPKVNGLEYTSKPGFYVESRELHFPVNGQPSQLDLLITNPLAVNPAVTPIFSRSFMDLGDKTEMQLPYEITGGTGLIVNATMDVQIPLGYKVEQVSLQTRDPQTLKYEVQSVNIEITPNSTTGTKVKIPLGNHRVAFPTFLLSFDTENAQALASLTYKGKDLKNGYTAGPLHFHANITGGYSLPAAGVAALKSFGVPMTEAGTTSGTVTPASIKVTLPVRTKPAEESAVFVGRAAPMFVQRGQEFTYTIFVGNQTALHLGPGTVSMAVPNGCVATKATLYKLNAHVEFSDGYTTESSGVYGEVLPAGIPTPVPPGTKVSEITWKTPIKNTLVTWKIGNFNPAEAGAMTLTVKVDENFVGDRIDDNSCWFRVANAMDKSAGPLGVVVLPKNPETGTREVVQKSVEGMGLKYTTAAGAALAQTFRVGTNSCGITIGGANYAQLEDSTAIIMLPKGRAMVIGQPNKVDDYDQFRTFTRIVRDSPELRIVVGPGTVSEQPNGTLLPDGVVLLNAPGYPGTYSANRILSDFVKSGVSLLGKRKANLVIGGGPNMLLTGANTLASADGSAMFQLPPTIKGLAAPQPFQLSSMVNAGNGVLSHNGNAIVAGGGGNIVAGGGGNIVAGGGGNIVAGGGGNVVANDGAGIVAGGGGNIVAGGGGNLIPATVAQSSGRIVAGGGGNLIGQDGAGIVAGGGGNIVAGGGGN
jgi:uncharacterized repeat protein (TIGR01451 family)